jgi:hypothetical protein
MDLIFVEIGSSGIEASGPGKTFYEPFYDSETIEKFDRWLQENYPSCSVIATTDIGRLYRKLYKFYENRPGRNIFSCKIIDTNSFYHGLCLDFDFSPDKPDVTRAVDELSIFYDILNIFDKGRSTGEIVMKAFKFAAGRHNGQKRKFTGKPYIIHPLRVSEIIREHGGGPAQRAAGMLHDTIEDTKTDYKDILDLFGSEIANLVMAVTNDPEEKGRLGKSEYLARKTSALGPRELLVKLADRLDNIRDLSHENSDWNINYAGETRSILSRLDPRLLDRSHKDIIGDINERIREYRENS